MAPVQVNGDIPTPRSAFLQHLLSYPVVSDSIDTVRANQYAQRSLKIGDFVYQTLGAFVILLLRKPYGYVSPYIERVDAIGDQTLDRVDERFPAIKKSTSELYHETRELALVPVHKAFEGKDHVLQIFAAEHKKTDQEGIVAHGKAAITTALVVSNETLSCLSSFVSKPRRENAGPPKDKANQ